MFKKLLAVLAMLYAAASFAAVDVNKATAADLDGIKGIGPGISGKILDERKNGAYKDWNDLITRVKGIGDGNAAKFSSEGMTVNGAAFAGAPAAKKDDKAMAKKEDKAMAKKEEKAAAAKEEKPMAAKAEMKEAKTSTKDNKKEEMTADKATGKTDKKAEKKDTMAKADPVKPAASAAKK